MAEGGLRAAMKGWVQERSPGPVGTGAGDLPACGHCGTVCGEGRSPSLPPSQPLCGKLPAVFLRVFCALDNFLLIVFIKEYFLLKRT